MLGSAADQLAVVEVEPLYLLLKALARCSLRWVVHLNESADGGYACIPIRRLSPCSCEVQLDMRTVSP